MKMYYTFGSADYYPFGRDKYVLVEADSPKQCHALFRVAFPDIHDNTLNCADYYSEGEWNIITKNDSGYAGVAPAVHLVSLDLMNGTNSDAVYRRLLRARLVQDATEWVDIVRSDYSEAKTHQDKVKLDILNSLDKDDLVWFADRYAQKYDCTMSDAPRWREFIEDFLQSAVA